MVLILIFAEVLGLYGLVISLSNEHESLIDSAQPHCRPHYEHEGYRINLLGLAYIYLLPFFPFAEITETINYPKSCEKAVMTSWLVHAKCNDGGT